MNELETLNLEQLRELFLSAPGAESTRLLAILLSGALVIAVLLLVRRGSLREEYTPVWMVVAFLIALVSIRMEILYAITRLIGAWTPSATLFFLGMVFLVVLSLNYAVRLSQANLRLKNLAQEVALLRTRLDRLGDD